MTAEADTRVMLTATSDSRSGGRGEEETQRGNRRMESLALKFAHRDDLSVLVLRDTTRPIACRYRKASVLEMPYEARVMLGTPSPPTCVPAPAAYDHLIYVVDVIGAGALSKACAA